MAELIEVKSELMENDFTRYEITSWKANAKDMSDWKWATLEASSETPTIIIIIKYNVVGKKYILKIENSKKHCTQTTI